MINLEKLPKNIYEAYIHDPIVRAAFIKGTLEGIDYTKMLEETILILLKIVEDKNKLLEKVVSEFPKKYVILSENDLKEKL